MTPTSFARRPPLPSRHLRPTLGTLLALTAALGPAACSSDDPPQPTPPANRPPVAVISADPTTVPEGDGNQTVVTLDGTGSSDPDGDPIAHAWNVPGGTFVGGTGANSSRAQVTFPGVAPYTVTLTVQDPDGAVGEASVVIQLGDPVPPPNQPPVAAASAAPDAVREGDANRTVVMLDGSASSDPDGDALTFSWDVPGGTFVGGTDATAEVAQVTFPGTDPYDVTLTVDDGNGGTDQAGLTVGLVANGVPIASVQADPTSVPPNDGNQTVVTIDASASTDPDGDALTFQWSVPGGTFVNGTTPTDATIQVTFPGTAPYTVTVTVSDGNGGEDQAQVVIGVQQQNQPPMAVVTANPTSVPAGDGNTTVVTIDASTSTDPDGDALSFQWTVPGGTFVNGTTPTDPTIQVTFPGAAPYTVTVVVSDGNGGQDQAQITITLS